MIKYRDFIEFTVLYWDGAYPNQRLGQAFCNHFNKNGADHSELFYMENDQAVLFIYDRYIDFSS